MFMKQQQEINPSIKKIKWLIDSGGDANIELAFSMASMFGEEVENDILLYWINHLTGESYTDLTTLKELYLFDNQLTSLPESIGNMTNLKELYLSVNQLTTLPESIVRLTNLEELSLSSNQLTTLPDSIGRLTNLENLYLRDNQLTSLPESIGRLTNLENLSLERNQLSEEEVRRIKQLLPKTDISF